MPRGQALRCGRWSLLRINTRTCREGGGPGWGKGVGNGRWRAGVAEQASGGGRGSVGKGGVCYHAPGHAASRDRQCWQDAITGDPRGRV